MVGKREQRRRHAGTLPILEAKQLLLRAAVLTDLDQGQSTTTLLGGGEPVGEPVAGSGAHLLLVSSAPA